MRWVSDKHCLLTFFITTAFLSLNSCVRIKLYSKTCLKWPLKKNTKVGFQYQLLLNAGQKYCRILQGEHSAILSAFIKLPFSIKTIILSIFKWPLKTGFTVLTFFIHVYLSKDK